MTAAAPTAPTPNTPQLSADEAANAEALRLLAEAAPEAPAKGTSPGKKGGDKAAPGAEGADKPAEGTDTAEAQEAPAKAEEKPKDRVFAALKRKGEAVKRDRAEVAEERAQLKAERAEAERMVSEQAAQLKAERAELGELRDIKRMAKEAPGKLVANLGIDLTALSQDILRGDAPEAKTDEVTKRLAEIERKQAEREAREREAAERAERATVAERAHKEFVGLVRGAANTYSYLDVFDDAEVIAYGDQMADEFTRAGKKINFEDVARELNAHLAKQYERLHAKLSRNTEDSDAERDTAQVTPAKPEAPRARTQTISNRASAESSGRTRPMTEKERDAEALRVLRGER